MPHNNISSIGFMKNTLLAWQPQTVINGHQSPGGIYHRTDYGSIQLLLRCQTKADAQTNSTTLSSVQPEVLEGGAPPPPCSPGPACPVLGLPGSTCLQESSAGGAQEHDGVVVDAGHRHRGQATVGEDRGGCDGVHDGQRVLEVRGSTVQLLRLQLRRDRHINGLRQTQRSPRCHCLGLSADKLLMGKAPHYRVMEQANAAG